MGELITKLGIDWKLLIANMVTFLIVLWVLRKFAYGPIIGALEKRRQTIADSLDEATKTKAEYAELQQTKERVIKEAKQQTQELIRQAETAAAELRQSELAKTQAEAQQLVSKTRAQLERERVQMVANAKADLAELVTTATTRVLGETIDADLEKKLQQQVTKAVKDA